VPVYIGMDLAVANTMPYGGRGGIPVLLGIILPTLSESVSVNFKPNRYDLTERLWNSINSTI